jgi:putative NIF3 family GTP cyclohydrolase 1 type 2
MKQIKFFIICVASAMLITSAQCQVKTPVTAETLIATIIKETDSEPVPNTVDVIKAGDPQTTVTGVVTCMFATMNVLKRAVELKCNLIITHEPVFYNHRDETKQFMNDPVFLEKKRFIDEHKLVIWRFHDYIHRIKPDGIDYGMAQKMNLARYSVNGEVNRFVLPETTLEALLRDLKKVFPVNTFNVIGNRNMKLSKVMFSTGAPGSAVHIEMLRDNNTDVVIAGEVPQWETYEYVRDAVEQGLNKAIIFLGHIPSEEAGMEFAATWLKGFVKNIPVHFVECGSSYWTY